MSIVCTICTDLVEPDQNLQTTRCGHLFHHRCLSEWIQSSDASNTCPQCRSEVSLDNLLRIYPTFSDEKTRITKIQSKFKSVLREKKQLQATSNEKENRLKNVSEINEQLLRALDSRNTELAELKNKLEEEIRQLRERLTTQQDGGDTEKLKEDNETLNREVSMLKEQLRLSDSRSDLLESKNKDMDKWYAEYSEAMENRACLLERRIKDHEKIAEVFEAQNKDMRQMCEQLAKLEQENEALKRERRLYDRDVLESQNYEIEMLRTENHSLMQSKQIMYW